MKIKWGGGMSHFFEVTVQERQTVETVLRVQGGFTRKQISRAKFLENGILKNGVRCRVSTWADPGDEWESVWKRKGVPLI